MSMKRMLKRWIALVLLAVFSFSHASLALADCPMDRATLSQSIARAAEEPCCASAVPAGYESLYGNRCVAHCTSDLRLAGLPVALLRQPADAPVLLLSGFDWHSPPAARLDMPSPEAVPPRILLHSFLI
jgi:hypothetical protein